MKFEAGSAAILNIRVAKIEPFQKQLYPVVLSFLCPIPSITLIARKSPTQAVHLIPEPCPYADAAANIHGGRYS